ncbi:Cytoplasmic dynein 1 intermediate chain [Cyphomyrmex costatus]|uniref:Cytoplasmic dynein 1 intermediate chain n=1 Tax=Cyphomyrmex costatus TaxID=456900 RepID=A0A195CM07_9HYME|nr:Cytoplasmic dynein 1 intermediate chain [Cyphomyrmex costatus]
MIILSEDFQRFLDYTSRIAERALSESVDIYTDYADTMDGEDGIISTDGKLCSWSLDMLSQPQETLKLHVNNFVMGSEDGTVYSACRHGSRVGLTETCDFSHLFLISSLDWTVKLWSLKENKPLYSFEHNDDFVYDVSWSPIHPVLFAAVDNSGETIQDTEVSTASVVVDGCPALNKVSWTPSGHVIVGNDTDKIWIYDAEHLAHPRIDEWNKFLYTQQDLKNNKADEELDKLNLSSGSSSLTSVTSISSVPLR